MILCHPGERCPSPYVTSRGRTTLAPGLLWQSARHKPPGEPRRLWPLDGPAAPLATLTLLRDARPSIPGVGIQGARWRAQHAECL